MKFSFDRIHSAVRMFVAPKFFPHWLTAVVLAFAILVLVRTPTIRESAINPAVVLSEPTVVHNGEVKVGRIELGPKREDHAEVVWQAAVRPGRKYLVSFNAKNERRFASIRLDGDFYGDQYDRPNQDFSVVIPAAAVGYRVERTIPSDAAPAKVWLRLFHFEVGVVEISNVSLRELSLAYRALLSASVLVAVFAGIGMALAGWRRMQKGQFFAVRSTRAEAVAWTACFAIVACVGVLGTAMLGPPQIFADEYAYRAITSAWHTGEWAGLYDTVYYSLPNRLFFAIYSLTGYAGNPFAAARAMNVVSLLAGIVVLYVASRRVGAGLAGTAIAIAYGIGPVSTYSAYFMPESLYFTAFMAAAVAGALALATLDPAVVIACASLLCAAVYIKPHAWVLVATLALLTLWRSMPGNLPFPRAPAARTSVIAVVTMLVGYVLLATLLPRVPTSSDAFGMYSGIVRSVFEVTRSPAKYPLALQLLSVHMAIVCAIAAPAFCYGIYAAARPKPGLDLSSAEMTGRWLCAVAALSLLGLVLLTALFSTAVAGTSPGETADRLHLRYYTFVIPLMLIGFLGSPAFREWSRHQWMMVLGIWAIACAAVIATLPRFHWTIIDAPDLFFDRQLPNGILGFIGALAVAGAVTFRTRFRGMALSVVGCYIVASLWAGWTTRALQLSWEELPEDRGGRFVEALAEQTGGPVIIVADLRQGLQWPYRIASYLPSYARFVKPDQLSNDVKNGLPPGAIIFGEADTLSDIDTKPIARFGTYLVARWSAVPWREH